MHVSSGQPRLCSIVKSYPEQEYGFNLHAERGKGQFIGAIDAGSPADLAGLRVNDHIVAVNGHYIEEETHQKVYGGFYMEGGNVDVVVVVVVVRVRAIGVV